MIREAADLDRPHNFLPSRIIMSSLIIVPSRNYDGHNFWRAGIMSCLIIPALQKIILNLPVFIIPARRLIISRCVEKEDLRMFEGDGQCQQDI